MIICQQDTKAGKPALTDALETVRQKLGKIDNAVRQILRRLVVSRHQQTLPLTTSDKCHNLPRTGHSVYSTR